MIIYTTDTKKIYDIQLRVQNNSGRNPGFEPDCFSDLECYFFDDHCTGDRYGLIFAADADVQDMIAWWEDEVNHANDDPDYIGDALCGFGENPDEKKWWFIVETEDYDEI